VGVEWRAGCGRDKSGMDLAVYIEVTECGGEATGGDLSLGVLGEYLLELQAELKANEQPE